MTPFKIEILLFYYYTLHRDFPDIDSACAKKAISEFVKAGIIIENPSGRPSRYSGNFEALEAYVKALCKIPLPEQRWVVGE